MGYYRNEIGYVNFCGGIFKNNKLLWGVILASGLKISGIFNFHVTFWEKTLGKFF